MPPLAPPAVKQGSRKRCRGGLPKDPMNEVIQVLSSEEEAATRSQAPPLSEEQGTRAPPAPPLSEEPGTPALPAAGSLADQMGWNHLNEEQLKFWQQVEREEYWDAITKAHDAAEAAEASRSRRRLTGKQPEPPPCQPKPPTPAGGSYSTPTTSPPDLVVLSATALAQPTYISATGAHYMLKWDYQLLHPQRGRTSRLSAPPGSR